MISEAYKIKSIACDLTAEDFKSAVRGHAANCVIGRYLQKKGFECVRVKDGHVKLTAEGQRITYAMPQVARVFVESFDKGSRVGPLKFNLDSRQASSRPVLLGATKKRNGKPRKSPTLPIKTRGRCADVRRTHALVSK